MSPRILIRTILPFTAVHKCRLEKPGTWTGSAGRSPISVRERESRQINRQRPVGFCRRWRYFMITALDRIEGNLARLRLWADHGKPLPFIDEGHDFTVTEPMPEAELLEIERHFDLTLPAEYRSFLGRFGDTTIGPGNSFRRVNEGLTARSTKPFPLAKPFLGACSPSHQRLPNERQREDFGHLLKQWDPIPKQDGVLAISDYGCVTYGVLILNGPYCGQVWILYGDSAYYGPFGGYELLHDESASANWTPNEQPREYSFFEWYESWLNLRLKMAGFLAW